MHIIKQDGGNSFGEWGGMLFYCCVLIERKGRLACAFRIDDMAVVCILTHLPLIEKVRCQRETHVHERAVAGWPTDRGNAYPQRHYAWRRSCRSNDAAWRTTLRIHLLIRRPSKSINTNRKVHVRSTKPLAQGSLLVIPTASWSR